MGERMGHFGGAKVTLGADQPKDTMRGASVSGAKIGKGVFE